MNDPFSARRRRQFPWPKKRRNIPWPQYQRLKTDISTRSLIGRSDFSDDDARNRLTVLKDFESRLGFVYYGEKQWLDTRLSTEQAIPYHKWVHRQLNEVVFPKGLKYGAEETIGNCWVGYTEDMTQFWTPRSLNCSMIYWDYVSVFIPGESSGPRISGICHAYEVLHDLSYHLHNLSEWFKSRAPLPTEIAVDEVCVHDQEKHWTIDFNGEYGHVGTFKVVGDEIKGWS